jgi:hypothetical protein
MADDDYTLLSSKEVSELKQDIDYLKKNPMGGTKEGKTLLESIDKLNENIEQLIEIFKEASDMVKSEEREADVIVRRIEPIERQLMELSDQNQKIAKGILAVADMVSAKEQQRPKPMMQQQPMQQRMPQMQAPMGAPRPMMPQMQAPRLPPMPGMPPTSGLPPLTPPKPEEKKGFLGGLLKK